MNKTVGAILLIAGCSIGTGMLGLPIVTGAPGFIPSCILFVVAWAFMAATGLALARVTLSFDTKETHLISIAENTLGKAGKWSTCILFSLLFYAVMVAYCIAGGRLIADFAELFFSVDLPYSYASTALAAIIFVAISMGMRSVDWLNRILISALFIFYFLLIVFGIQHVETERLARVDWRASLPALPILVIAFGYQNLVPSLAHYLDKDRRALTKAIWIGSLIPLLIYLLWEFVILGVIPFTEKAQWLEVQGHGEMITQLLARVSGSDMVLHMARGFAFFAIATSFLPIAFSFLDFLRDGLHLPDTAKVRIPLGVVVMVPPLVVALTHPHLFLVALSYAGGFCAVLLFGFLPSLMAWKRKVLHPFLATLLIIGSITILILTLLHELAVI